MCLFTLCANLRGLKHLVISAKKQLMFVVNCHYIFTFPCEIAYFMNLRCTFRLDGYNELDQRS